MLLALSVISSQSASLGPTAYKVFDERGGSIGRLDSNDWTLPDAEKFVSSRHACVRFAHDAFYLEDMSTNGTFVNVLDHPIPKEEPTRLHDGDRIRIGNYDILVQLIDNRGPTSPTHTGPHAPHATQTVVLADATVSASPTAHLATTTHPTAVTGQFAAGAAPAPFQNPGPAPSAVTHGANGAAAHYSPQPAHTQSAAPSYPSAPMHGGPQDMLVALGLDPSRVSPNIYQQLGHILRTVVHGLINVLQSRMEVKSNFRMPVTSIRPVENNPLKFSLNTEDALHNLFVKRNPGYLAPIEAFEEGFQDIAFHQMAMLAGVRAAFHAMLAKFHPDHLEVVYERKLRRTTFFQLGNRFRYWGMYRAQFEDIEKNMEAHFQLLFGEEFARAYSEQLQKLTSAARRDGGGRT
jgi:type VI secretion system FHA domain protein